MVYKEETALRDRSHVYTRARSDIEKKRCACNIHLDGGHKSARGALRHAKSAGGSRGMRNVKAGVPAERPYYSRP